MSQKIILSMVVCIMFTFLGCTQSEADPDLADNQSRQEKNLEEDQTTAPQGNEEKPAPDSEEETAGEEDVVKVTFIELGSKGCVPCDMMQPIMEEIKSEYPNQVKVIFYDVKTQDGYAYAQKYKIRVIPTQIFLDNKGNEYFRHEGFFPKEEIVKVLLQQGVR